MGARLSEQGNHKGALRLEDLCNRLQREESFELLCQYPLNGALEGAGPAVSEICHQHTSVHLNQGLDSAQGAAETMQVLLETTRTLLRVGSAEQAVGALMRAVVEFGGTCLPADKAPATAIPIDISLGHAAPLLPHAAPGSPARRTIERVLPGLVEDARKAADTAGRMASMSTQIDTDPLTGLGNRRGLGRLRRLVNSDTIVVLDLDHFKQVNDTHGHDAGDRVRVAFSRTLRQRLRSADAVYRLGGEEFLMLLRDTSPESALVVLEQLRLKWTSERPLPVTFSAGIASIDGDLDTAMRRADSALYVAKAHGRDRFDIATSSSATVLDSIGQADVADTGRAPKRINSANG
jgi:diguanylate cyclase (GGDEF)-like protein